MIQCGLPANSCRPDLTGPCTDSANCPVNLVTRVMKWLLVRGQMHGIHLHAAPRNRSVVKKQCWSKDKVRSKRGGGVTKLGTMRSEGTRAIRVAKSTE